MSRQITPRWRDARSLGLVGVMVVAALAPAPATAARPIAFRVVMGGCPKGQATNAATLRVIWRDADGVLKAAGSTTASATGNWTYCGTAPGDPGPEGIDPGDRITVAERGGETRTLIVPRFVVRVDRQTDVVSGRAPARTEVHITVSSETQDATVDVPVDANGRFSSDITDRFDIRGGDSVTMEQLAGRDTFRTTARAPWLRVWLGRPVLDWSGRAGTAGLVTLTTADRRTATAPVGEGSGRSRFLDADDDPIRPRAGDVVDGTVVGGDALIRVPDIRLTLATTTDEVVATCPVGLAYHLTVLKGGSSTTRFDQHGVSAGRVEVDLTGRLNVVLGSVATLDCVLATGDRVAIRRVAG